MGNWTKDLRWWWTCYVMYSFEGLGVVINITVVVLVSVRASKVQEQFYHCVSVLLY